MKRTREEILERNAFGEKACNTCDTWLPESDFSIDMAASDGLMGRCKTCGRFARYKLTRDDIANMLAAQDNRCPICNKALVGLKDFAVDHDHRCCSGSTCCGKCNRGLVCTRCNVMVLSTLENDELVSRAMYYLEQYRD